VSLLNNQIFTHNNLFFNVPTINLLHTNAKNMWKFFHIDKTLILHHPLVLQNKKQPVYNFFQHKCMLQDFFSLVNVDVPIFLQKKSQKNKNLIGSNTRWFTNLLMLRGAKLKTLKTLVQSFIASFNNLGLMQFGFYTPKSWKIVYYTAFFKTLRAGFSTKPEHFFTFFLNVFTKKGLPIFTFDVQKTDKNLVKYSRGKSGRYSLVWRYVPSYKRLGIVYHWLKKEIRLQKSFTFQKRVSKTIETIFLHPSTSLVLRLRTFVHKFVFFKYKKKLLKTLNQKN